MMKTECPICHAEAKKAFSGGPNARYFKCLTCRSLFQSPMPSVSEMKTYAEKHYSDGAYSDYVKAKPMKVATFRQRAAQFKKFLSAKSKVRHLDVGCSAGFMIEVGLENGFDSYGVEFSDEAIKKALPEIASRIRQGDVNSLLKNSAEKFDLITCFDIVEHVQNPTSFLEELKKVLNPGGILVLTTPDVDHYLAKVMGSRWPMLQPEQHTILFTRESLTKTLGLVGFATLEQSSAYKVLSFNYLSGQLQELNPLLSGLMRTLDKALPNAMSRKPIKLNISEFLTVARG